MDCLLTKIFHQFIFYWIVFSVLSFKSFSSQSSELLGSVSILLQGGSESAPNHSIISPSLKGKSVFRGQVEGALDNNISFYRIPDLLDPTVLSKPFKPGIFSTQKARAVAVLSDNNFTIDRLDLIDGGNNYLEPPDVFIRFPTFTQGYNGIMQNAYARSQTVNSLVTGIILTDAGNGYSKTPTVKIEGGPHFISLVDSDSNYTGKFYRISGNSGDQVTIENPLNDSLQVIFSPDSEIEIFEAWTLGELLGYESTSLNYIDPITGAVTYDYLYLLTHPFSQNGNVGDFEGFFHDQTSWKRLDSPSVDASHQVILPNQSFVIARRSSDTLNLVLSGVALSQKTFIDVPSTGKRLMLSNPYSVDLMLSDLIDSNFITENNQTSFFWLANPNQENADNVKVLKDGVWSTYWHDGKNRLVTENAYATARPGSGPGASLMQRDISLSEGLISGMSNPTYASGEFVEVISPSHGLREGFIVKITGAVGYKTNDLKQLINDQGEVVEQNSSALVIESGANGFFTVVDVTLNSFKLDGKAGDCNFIPNGEATWSTGSTGNGYEYDCAVSFVGGGGSGAKGVANVNLSTRKIDSISITERGSGYVEAPKVIIHEGGWRKLGAGNTPFSDVLIPAASGFMIVRNHPTGGAVRLPVRNPFQ